MTWQAASWRAIPLLSRVCLDGSGSQCRPGELQDADGEAEGARIPAKQGANNLRGTLSDNGGEHSGVKPWSPCGLQSSEASRTLTDAQGAHAGRAEFQSQAESLKIFCPTGVKTASPRTTEIFKYGLLSTN